MNSDLEDVLLVIVNLVDSYHCDDIIIGDDMNIDFDGKMGMFERFLISNTLESSWMRFNIEFEANEITYTSNIDHIIYTAKMNVTSLRLTNTL